MPIEIRAFLPADYDAAMAIWEDAEGVTLRAIDAREPLTSYLGLHRGLSFVATVGGRIVGAVLCGTDGRRGYLNHLAVAAEYQRRGIGRRLAEACIAELSARGIEKCHLMVKADNPGGRAFWAHLGWDDRSDIRLMSYNSSSSPNA